MIANLTLGRNQDGSGVIHIPKEVYEDFLNGIPITKISGDCRGEFKVEIRLTRDIPEHCGALWMRNQYIVMRHTGSIWVSKDGDIWTYQNGHPVTSKEFKNCVIKLNGGPRNGESVR